MPTPLHASHNQTLCESVVLLDFVPLGGGCIFCIIISDFVFSFHTIFVLMIFGQHLPQDFDLQAPILSQWVLLQELYIIVIVVVIIIIVIIIIISPESYGCTLRSLHHDTAEWMCD